MFKVCKHACTPYRYPSLFCFLKKLLTKECWSLPEATARLKSMEFPAKIKTIFREPGFRTKLLKVLWIMSASTKHSSLTLKSMIVKFFLKILFNSDCVQS